MLMEMEEEFLGHLEKFYGSENKQKIVKAFHFAEKKHAGQKRENGDEYITHPYSVAKILVNMRADVPSVIAGILHDLIEDTDTKPEEIENAFGKEVASICFGLSKIETIKKARREHLEENENLRKMILSMEGDARIAFVKLADRLNNMQTLDCKSRQDQVKISKETMDLFVPLAERLGMNGLKHSLEDLCFKYMLPEEYEETTNYLNEYYKRSQAIVEEIRGKLKKLADDLGIKVKLQSRLKSSYGVYKKTMTKGRNKIFDIIAHRVITKDVKDCYAMLGAIHNVWKPVEGRIKDYIANPKKNLYMSLHTTVMYPTENGSIPFEIQIRTEEMHVFCEYGMAAHWMYKEHGSKATSVNGNSALLKMKKELASSGKALSEDEVDEFLEVVKAGFYSDQIFVFTPSLNVIELPKGSITLDFAYAIHTGLGNRCTGAKVNGRMVPITTELHTGDVVEILTASGKSPSRDWIKICKSHGAITKIKQFFKKERRDENIKIGKSMLEEYAKRKGYSLAKLLEDKETLAETLERRQLASLDDIYATVGYGGITTTVALSAFIAKQQSLQKKAGGEKATNVSHKEGGGILIDGHNDLLKNLAKCCNPIPGDEIIGYVSKGRGIIIHKLTCPNVEKLEKERFIDADWDIASSDFTFTSIINVYAKSNNNVYTDIANALAELGVKMISLSSTRSKNEDLDLKVGVLVKDKNQLRQVKNKLGSLSSVYEVL